MPQPLLATHENLAMFVAHGYAISSGKTPAVMVRAVAYAVRRPKLLRYIQHGLIKQRAAAWECGMKLRHIVLFGFVAGTSPGAISEVVRRFAALRTLVPNIDSFEWGENCSPENLHKGHSHAFLLTFPSAEARDAYLPHPAHQAFVEWVSPFVSSATVIDYWVAESPP
jgi:hypothetical protein